MQELVCLLHHPQSSFPCIHVAGTNGKGSTCAMLDEIYRSHGYRVGLFTSPHLVELGERVRVDGRPLSWKRIERWVERLLPLCRKMAEKEKDMHPTFFELMTAIAFLEFKEQAVDLAIIETGLGGRLDSTNVVVPEVSVITSIGLDHCELLGEELSQIAREKAGILKPAKPVVFGWLEKEAENEIVQVARERGCDLIRADQNSSDLPETNLRGSFQKRNAALAFAVAKQLNARFPVLEKRVFQALKRVRLSGRWQMIRGDFVLILDACHNGEGARAMSEVWAGLPPETVVWYAACGLGRASEVLPLLLPHAGSLVLFGLCQPRACSPRELIPLTQGFCGRVTQAMESQISELLQQVPPGTTVLVTGSIYLVASVLGVLEKNQSWAKQVCWQDHW